MAGENTLLTDLEGRLVMYVVYWNATDFPGMFVIRRWRVTADSLEVETEPMGTAWSLKEVRRLIPEGTYRIPREDADDPAIFETWV